MNYNNKSIRRQDRLLSEEKAVKLLQNAEYGTLAMQSETGGGYAVPVSYVWDGRNAVYVHCAPEGRKVQCIMTCPKVTLCVVGKTNVLPEQFTTEYESVLLEGNASIKLSDSEKMKVLEMIIHKFSPQHKELGKKYAKKSFHRTEIIKIEINNWSGKTKNIIK